jgi:uncharacterized 2Fe-2S/4Fe-4S cluster protein (DUF4445 family)
VPITVRFVPGDRTWRGDEPADLSFAAATCDILLDQPCGSKTTCGKCRVRVHAGALPAAAVDVRVLGAEAVADGWRLGCQLVLDADAAVEVPPAARALAGKSFGDAAPLAAGFTPPASCAASRAASPGEAADNDATSGGAIDGRDGGAGHGVAIDVGSTTLAVALVRLDNGAVAATAAQLNPQVRWGGDVISRIHRAQEQPARAHELHDVLVQAIDALVTQCLESAPASRHQVHAVSVVGNPTMLHTLLGADVTPLGQAPYVGVLQGAWRGRARELGLDLPARADAYVLPGVFSHVGADTVAALLAAGIDQREKPCLLIDLGTNSEVALGCRDFIACTSTSAGPAFEGANIRHGMRAVAGAIDQVRVRPTGSIMVHAIGGEEPVGLCGSGLIDAVAELVRTGVIEPAGRMRPAAELGRDAPRRLLERVHESANYGRAVWLAGPAHAPVLLTAGDVRQVQLAKGSIQAGVQVLLAHAGITADDLDAVLVAGSFGNCLRKSSAQAIGLVPQVDPERVHFIGNAAGAGARLALVSMEARARGERIAEVASYIELAQRLDYHDAFIAGMAFPAPAAEAGRV